MQAQSPAKNCPGERAGICELQAGMDLPPRPPRTAVVIWPFSSALTQLEADALITLDRQLADAVKDLVTVAPIEALF